MLCSRQSMSASMCIFKVTHSELLPLIAAHCCSLSTSTLCLHVHCYSLYMLCAQSHSLLHYHCSLDITTQSCNVYKYVAVVRACQCLDWSYVFGYLCSGSVWALYAQIACFDWCHVYSDVIGSCILVMIGSLILIVIGSELFVALEIVFPEVTWCKVIMASTRVIAKFQCKEFIKCMYLDLAGHIRVRLRVLTV